MSFPESSNTDLTQLHKLNVKNQAQLVNLYKNVIFE
jgi:hypothetical protein